MNGLNLETKKEKKWKRLKGKENAGMERTGVLKPKSQVVGSKRNWLLKDEKEENSCSTDVNKRFKGQEDTEVMDITEASQPKMAPK